MRFEVKLMILPAVIAAIFCLTVQAFAAPAPSPWTLSNTATVVKVKNEPYPAVFQLTSRIDATELYGVTGGNIDYAPQGSLYFQDIYQLSLDWKALTDWGGGSPRFSLAIDVDGDGAFTTASQGGVDAWAFVYVVQQFPSFNGGPTGWQNTGNLVGATTGIWDTTQFGGAPGYGNYAGALAYLNGKHVLKVTLAVDGGWLHGWSDTTFQQVVWANNVTLNGNVFVAPAAATGGRKK